MDEQTPVLNFPFEALDLIARDEPLVELLRAKVLAAASP